MIVKIDAENRLSNGIQVVRHYEEQKLFRPRSGVVVSVCDKLIFHDVAKWINARDFGVKDQQYISGLTRTSVYYDVPIEVKPGDCVMFKHMSHENGWLKLDDEHLLIRYDNLVSRDDYPLNGLIFLKMDETAQDDVLHVSGNEFDVDFRMGTVVAEGCKIKKYLLFPEYSGDFDVLLLGKKVLLAKKSAVRITHDDHTDGKPLYMTRRYHINAFV